LDKALKLLKDARVLVNGLILNPFYRIFLLPQSVVSRMVSNSLQYDDGIFLPTTS